jgi:hypothetical protein
MTNIVVNVNTCLMMGKIISDIRPVKNGDAVGTGPAEVEFDVETKRYTENASRPTVITCVAGGKQAELITLQKKKGDIIAFSGYLGEFLEFGNTPCTFGRHKIRITRFHVEYINLVIMEGKIVTQLHYDDKTKTAEFFIETMRRRNVACRMRVVCEEYNAQLMRAFKQIKIPGTYIEVIGMLVRYQGEHAILPSRIELLLSEQDKQDVLKKLNEGSKHERKESVGRDQENKRTTTPTPNVHDDRNPNLDRSECNPGQGRKQSESPQEHTGTIK